MAKFSPAIRIGDTMRIRVPGANREPVSVTVEDVHTCAIAGSVGIREVVAVYVQFRTDGEPVSIMPDWIVSGSISRKIDPTAPVNPHDKLNPHADIVKGSAPAPAPARMMNLPAGINRPEPRTVPATEPASRFTIQPFKVSDEHRTRYTVDASDTLVKVSAPEPRFLAKRSQSREVNSFPTLVKLCLPGSVWGSGNVQNPVNCVTVDKILTYGKNLVFVFFTDSEGFGTKNVPIRSFLARFPIPVEVERKERKERNTEPAPAPVPVDVNQFDASTGTYSNV